MNLYKLYQKLKKLIFIITLIAVILFLYNYFINKTIEGNSTFSQSMNSLTGNNFNVHFLRYNSSDFYLHIMNENNQYLIVDNDNNITTQTEAPNQPVFFFSNTNILRSTNFTSNIPDDDNVYLFNAFSFERIPASQIYINDDQQSNIINSQEIKNINKFTLFDNKTFIFTQSSPM